MSTNDLLKPRYKVMIKAPNCFKVGTIIEKHKYASGNWYVPNCMYDPDDYPEVFKKLEWWEDLTPEQVPKYIKSKDRKEVREVIELTPEGFKAKYPERPKGYRICYNNRWLPATQTEYEQHINQKENQ